MGACFSNRIKAGTPIHQGVNSTNVSKDLFSSVPIPSTSRSEGEILRSFNLKSFRLSDLRTATENFHADNLVGKGAFGSIFKGWVDEHSLSATQTGTGLVIAVKRLNKDGSQGHKEWLAEINYLGQLHHPNLVKLIGHCLEDHHRLLVYEFMSQGSVEKHLFGDYIIRPEDFGHQPLSWRIRMKVALGAAKGLAFLHMAERKVIYRDFKTSAILLDSNYNAKLSDFGLARDGPIGDKSHVSTGIKGTSEYAAPEYLATGHLTTKCDVYSFGVVLLELLSGRRALDMSLRPAERNLIKWAIPKLTKKGRIARVLDARLEGQCSSSDQASQVAKLALRCLSEEARVRPRMDEVVSALEQILNSKDTVKSAHKQRRSLQF